MLDEYFRTRGVKELESMYPHLHYPAVVKATVTEMEQVSNKVWKYNIKLLKQDLTFSNMPEIPNIKSHVEVEAGVGGIVAVGLLYGLLEPVIIDEVIP